MSKLTYHSRRLCGYHVAPAPQTVGKGARDVPWCVEKSWCQWKLMDSCRWKGFQKLDVLQHS